MTEEKKANKTLVIVLIGIIVILIVGLVIVFFSKNNDAEVAELTNSSVANEIVNTELTTNTQEENSTYIGDDFTILQPAEWVQSTIINTLVSFVKQNETQPAGSAAERIHFQSYMAVSFDTMGDKTLDEIYQQTIDSISRTVSNMNVFSVENETINGFSSKLVAMEFTSQEVDYTVLLVIYVSGGAYYSFSFNTTTPNWPEYNTLAYQVARSFQSK